MEETYNPVADADITRLELHHVDGWVVEAVSIETRPAIARYTVEWPEYHHRASCNRARHWPHSPASSVNAAGHASKPVRRARAVVANVKEAP